jgi:hypothetical protein
MRIHTTDRMVHSTAATISMDGVDALRTLPIAGSIHPTVLIPVGIGMVRLFCVRTIRKISNSRLAANTTLLAHFLIKARERNNKIKI